MRLRVALAAAALLGLGGALAPGHAEDAAPTVALAAPAVVDPALPRFEPQIDASAALAIPEGLGNEPKLVSPQGAIQGRNGRGGYGWFGPRPPAGHGVHRYYFQVFALNDWIEMGPDTPHNELLNALKARTLAKGEMMATYEAPTEQ